MDRHSFWIGALGVLLALGMALAQVSDPDAVKRRALALAQAGDYAQARADLERLLSEHPNDLQTRKLLARVLIAARAASEAAAHLERAVAADPAAAEARCRTARLLCDIPASRESPRRGRSAGAPRGGARSRRCARTRSAAGARAASGRVRGADAGRDPPAASLCRYRGEGRHRLHA